MKRRTLTLGATLGLTAAVVAFAPLPAPFFSSPSCSGPFPIFETDLPYMIMDPGLYCLMEDMTGVADMTGITVASNGVVIDLQGYTLTGKGESTGIYADGHDGITIRNGTLLDWSGNAVKLSGSRHRVEDVHVENGGQDAILGAVRVGSLSRVERCLFTNMAAPAAVFTSQRGVVADCLLIGSVADGFVVDMRSVIERCTVDNAAGAKFKLGDASRIVDCTAFLGSSGIETGDDCAIVDCQVRSVQTFGIDAGARCRITGCSVYASPAIGIAMDQLGWVTDCVVERSAVGYQLGADVIATNCVARGNTGDGFALAEECVGPYRLSGCIASGNGQHGIVAPDQSEVLRCTAADNVEAGIRIEGNHARVEGNQLVDNGTGIQIIGTDNLVTWNSMADHTTPFAIPPGNTRGALVTNNDWIKGGNAWVNFNLTFP